jgi:hypothetical protein
MNLTEKTARRMFGDWSEAYRNGDPIAAIGTAVVEQVLADYCVHLGTDEPFSIDTTEFENWFSLNWAAYREQFEAGLSVPPEEDHDVPIAGLLTDDEFAALDRATQLRSLRRSLQVSLSRARQLVHHTEFFRRKWPDAKDNVDLPLHRGMVGAFTRDIAALTAKIDANDLDSPIAAFESDQIRNN